jgi:autotransporter-associated beta strand protein
VLSGANNTYTGATLVSAGTLFVTGALTSNISVSDNATIGGGGGTTGTITFGGGSFFDIALPVSSANSLDSSAISFATTGFGIDNLVFNGTAVDWSTIANGTYTLITGTLNSTNLGNFGSGSAADIGGGRTAYFQSGSLQLVVIPEPSTALLGAIGLLALLRRRR